MIRAAWKLAQKAAENRPEEIFVAADIGPVAENLFSEYETDPAAEYRFLADCFLECGAQILTLRHFQILNMWQKQPDISKKNAGSVCDGFFCSKS